MYSWLYIIISLQPTIQPNLNIMGNPLYAIPKCGRNVYIYLYIGSQFTRLWLLQLSSNIFTVISWTHYVIRIPVLVGQTPPCLARPSISATCATYFGKMKDMLHIYIPVYVRRIISRDIQGTVDYTTGATYAYKMLLQRRILTGLFTRRTFLLPGYTHSFQQYVSSLLW